MWPLVVVAVVEPLFTLTVVPMADTVETPVLWGEEESSMLRGGLLAARIAVALMDVPEPEPEPPPPPS